MDILEQTYSDVKLEEIRKLLRYYRTRVIRMPMRELVEGTDTTLGSINMFENGKSNRLNHIFVYLEKCNYYQRDALLDDLATILKGDE